MYSKSCSGGSLIAEIVNNGGDMWLLNDAGLEKAKPGDVLVKATSKVTQAKMGTKVSTSHAMIYIGDGKISHAASSKTGIKTESLKDSFRWKDGCHFFVRPKDLKDADAKESQTSTGTNPNSGNSGGVTEATGSVDGNKYVARIPGAVCTSYSGGGGSASGLGLTNNKTCASHNLPYGTVIYVPSLAGVCGDGTFTVTDTGGSSRMEPPIYRNINVKNLVNRLIIGCAVLKTVLTVEPLTDNAEGNTVLSLIILFAYIICRGDFNDKMQK
jgi:3D (Asp-Asp-Asp) domain-containing protein